MKYKPDIMNHDLAYSIIHCSNTSHKLGLKSSISRHKQIIVMKYQKINLDWMAALESIILDLMSWGPEILVPLTFSAFIS